MNLSIIVQNELIGKLTLLRSGKYETNIVDNSQKSIKWTAMATIIIFERPYGTLCAFEQPYHHWTDGSGERATQKVSNHTHFHSQQSSIWAPMATKIIFDRPYGTLCAFEMATPPSDHIIIGQIVAVSQRPRKFLIILMSTLTVKHMGTNGNQNNL